MYQRLGLAHDLFSKKCMSLAMYSLNALPADFGLYRVLTTMAFLPSFPNSEPREFQIFSLHGVVMETFIMLATIMFNKLRDEIIWAKKTISCVTALSFCIVNGTGTSVISPMATSWTFHLKSSILMFKIMLHFITWNPCGIFAYPPGCQMQNWFFTCSYQLAIESAQRVVLVQWSFAKVSSTNFVNSSPNLYVFPNI